MKIDINARNIGTIAAYAAYNVGVGILVGFVRTLIALGHLAKYFFQTQMTKRENPNSSVAKTLADGKWAGAKKLWMPELKRGIAELVWLGAPISTLNDFHKKKINEVDIFGLGELKKMIVNGAKSVRA